MDEPREERGQLDLLMPVVYEELRGLAGLLLSDKAAHPPRHISSPGRHLPARAASISASCGQPLIMISS